MAFVLLSGYLLQWAESFKGQLARLGLSCQVSSHCQTQASAILSSALSPNPWSQSFFPEFDPWHFSVLSHARSSSPGDLQGNALLGLETWVLLISSWQLLKEWRLTQVSQYTDKLLQLSFFDQLQCGQIQDIKMTSRSVSRDSSTPDIGGSCQDVMFHFLTNNQNKLFVSSRLFSQRQPLRAQGAVWRPSHKPVLLISSTSSGALMSPTNIGPRDAFANKSNLKQIQF